MSAATPSTATRSTPASRASSRLAKLPVSVTGAIAALAGAAALYAYGTLAQALDVPLRASLVLVAISLVFPLAASHAATTTRLTLALGHLIAAAIVILIIARRLTHAPGRPGQVRRG
jgi:hypothetical protein